MIKFEDKKLDLVVTGISRNEKENKSGTTITFSLTAKDKEGLNEVTIKSANPFLGISAKDGVINVTIKQSQKKIDDFEDEKE